MKRFCRQVAALALILATLLFCLPFASAQNNWNMEYFLKKYSDPHFDLSREPDRAMTVEEFLAIVYVYSYYGDGAANVTAKDKNGALPSAWAAKYVQAEVDKGVVDPGRISWSQPVTLAFAAQYLARAKGKYSYDAVNLYSFTGTQGLNADDILYLDAAVDYGLIPYSSGMNVSQQIPRRDARKYEVPGGAVTAKAPFSGNGNTMREFHAYFVDCYWDLKEAKRQTDILKQYGGGDFTMITFQSGYLNGKNISKGNTYLGCDLEHTEAVKYSADFSRDPQLDAIDWCKKNGVLALFGVSNAENDAFPNRGVRSLLRSSSEMSVAANEIVNATLTYGMDGVNLGIELGESDSDLRAAYAEFTEILAYALHRQGKLLMVSVGAYFTTAQELASFYDYAAISQSADYVHVILYDDYNDTGYPWRKTDGPVSNLTRVGRVLRYACVRMDPAKLLVGTAGYAVDFDRTNVTADDIPYSEALRLQSSSGAAMQWDAAAYGAYFDYAKDGANHRVYLETTGGIAARAKLSQQYNLCGVSIYYVSGLAPQLWQEITKTTVYKPEIMSACAAGLVPPSMRCRYDRPITRQEFCSIIAAFLTVSAVKVAPGSVVMFTDCTDKDVSTAASYGIVNGYPDGTFRPNNTITRQEAATILMRLAKLCGMTAPNAQSVSFTETPTLPAWALDGVNFVSACVDPTNGKRVMGGTGNGRFSPAASYTREQSMMTAIRLYHAIGKK